MFPKKRTGFLNLRTDGGYSSLHEGDVDSDGEALGVLTNRVAARLWQWWVNGWVSERVSECQWKSEWVSVKEWVSEYLNELVRARVCEWAIVCPVGLRLLTNRVAARLWWVNGWVSGWVNGWVRKRGESEWVSVSQCMRAYRLSWISEWVSAHGWASEWVSEWLRECMNQWVSETEWVTAWVNMRVSNECVGVRGEWASHWLINWVRVHVLVWAMKTQVIDWEWKSERVCGWASTAIN